MPVNIFNNATRNTSIIYAPYLVLKPLSKQLRAEAKRLEEQGRKNQIIVDIGCGQKPFQTYFNALASKYWGLDIDSSSLADVISSAHTLPCKDSSVDMVLCLQVLEHCEYPDKVLSEIRRILRPGGIALVSTHGTAVYHPVCGDYWRWTHKSLEVAFESAGLEVTKVLPNGGPIACLFFLGITLLSMFTYQSRWLTWMRWFLVPFFNFVGDKLDSLFFGHIYPKSKFLLVANYLVISRKSL